MTYRLALALGRTSLGWCVLKTKDVAPVRIVDMGVRIFPDGRDHKTKEPLAVARRFARGRRRTLDRRSRRQQRLMAFLIEAGLMPADRAARKALESLDPYELRAKALDGKIPLYHLGRALFHINQRRGFKGNRNTDRQDDDSSNTKTAIRNLDLRLLATGSRTLGEYLYKERRAGYTVRSRPRMVNNKAEYDFFAAREICAKEVDAILEIQKTHHAQLTDVACDRIKDIIFYQRPLRPAVVGKCRFETAEFRARLALPIVQKFRILHEVNNLKIEAPAGDRPLDGEERQKIIEALLSSRRKTFSQTRTLLKLGRDCRFNLETVKRKELKGAETDCALSDDTCFGARWHELPESQQEQVIKLLFDEADPDELVHLLAARWRLTPERAETIANASMPDGYGVVSKKAILKMMPYLEQGMKYWDAANAAGYQDSDSSEGEVFDHLPYYGQVLPNNLIGGTQDQKDKNLAEKYFGKVTDPSLHIALNQLRKLVNAVIEIYGTPDEIVVGLARELKQPADEIARERADSRKDDERINKELATLNVARNSRNRMLFRLWEDLATEPERRCCPFSGLPIAITDIFSGEFEEEYLLPFPCSYNDARANKVLSSREWNRRKAGRTPFEAFGHTEDWPHILARIENLPENKRWCFKEDALTRMQGKDGVIARTLNDKHYAAKSTRRYLSALFYAEKAGSRVWAVPGKMTPLLRDRWGLNDLLASDDGQEGPADHRQHAIDALVIGCTDQFLLTNISRAAGNLEQDENPGCQPITRIPEPFDGIRTQLEQRLSRMVVSYKPDHGGAWKAIHAEQPYTVAALHRKTAYGLIKNPQDQTPSFAHRVPVESLLRRLEIERVADAAIRKALLAAVEGLPEGGPEWKQAIQEAAAPSGTTKNAIMKNGIRRVRVRMQKRESKMIGLYQHSEKGWQHAKPYKYYEPSGNYCAEIYSTVKGKKAGQWQCEIISNYHAHQKDFIPQWRRLDPTAALIMRLQINDMVVYESEGQKIISKVKHLARLKTNTIFLRPHNIATEETNKPSWGASAKQLQLKNARKLSVDITGRINKSRTYREKDAA